MNLLIIVLAAAILIPFGRTPSEFGVEDPGTTAPSAAMADSAPQDPAGQPPPSLLGASVQFDLWKGADAEFLFKARADWLAPQAQRVVDVCLAPVPLDCLQAGYAEHAAGEEQTVLGERVWSVILGVLSWKKTLAAQPAPAKAGHMMVKLKAIFANEGVPPELAWLAEVESSLDAAAESPSGALGLYQFMPVTAERFGLRTGDSDDRTSPEKSARAAAQYLRVLHKRFGSWGLALAAYNAGEGRVGRILKQHAARTFDEIAEDLPSQTRTYVPKVIATLAVREKAILNTLPPPQPANKG